MEQYTETATNILHLILPAVIAILTPAVVVIARAVAKKLTEKLDAETKIAAQHMVDEVVGKGVAYAEQYAKAQEKIIKQKIDGEHKLEFAVRYVLEELEKNKLPELTAADIEKRVESYLGVGTLNKNFMKEEGGDNEYVHETE